MLIENLYAINKFEQGDNEILAQIELNPEHDIFKGHFPGNPVMPGVCMMQIIKEITEMALDKKLFLTESNNIKFMSIINPQTHPCLDLTLTITEKDGSILVRNTTHYEDVLALKLSASFILK